jgi:uncharacterized protein YjdB
MTKLSPVARRVRRFPSTLAMLAVALLTAAGCESSSGTDNSIAAVYVTPPSPIITVGQLRQLVATATNSSGEIITGQNVTWTTSAPNVATVAANGLVTGIAGGTAQITATVGGESATADITVWFPTTAVSLAPAPGQSLTIRQEGAVQLRPTFTDANGGTSTNRQVAWTSSNPAIAVVSITGFVSGLGTDGTSTITARSNEGVEGTAVVTVSGPPEVATVTISPSTLLLGLGTSFQLNSAARAASGTLIPGAPTDWVSGNDARVTVDGTGLVTAAGIGAATTITATAEGVSGTASVTVIDNLPAGATAVPAIADNATADYALVVQPGTTQIIVQMSGATSGDADLYLFAPGVTPGAGPAFSGFACRPYLIGSNETCTIANPAPGGWRVKVHAYPGDGTVNNLVLTATITP